MGARVLAILTVAAALAAVSLFAGVTGAQETAAEDDPLSRYDSPSTARMAAEYEQNQKRAEEIEAEIEALEDAGEWGEERSDLREELSEMTDATDAANALGDARLSDIESAPLPDGGEAKAEELRRKAASLDALQSWGDMAPINVDSRLYGILGEGEAGRLAGVYRKEAGALEVKANAAEVAREEAAPTPEPNPEEETPGNAADGADGGKEPVEERPAEEEPEPAPVETGTGLLGAVNPVPILIFAALAIGGVYALSRSAGVSVGKFFSPAMAEVRKPKPKPKPAPKKTAPKKTKAATTSKPTTSTPSEDPQPEPPEDREEETGPTPEELQRMFDLEAEPEGKPGPRAEDGDDDDDDDLPDFDTRL